jgi:hypothetical protein
MAWHQAVPVQAQPVLLDRLRQGSHELPPIDIVTERSAAFVAAGGDVIHRTRIFDSEGARHSRKSSSKHLVVERKVKCEVLPPFFVEILNSWLSRHDLECLCHSQRCVDDKD